MGEQVEKVFFQSCFQQYFFDSRRTECLVVGMTFFGGG